jgi:hypothetical protein
LGERFWKKFVDLSVDQIITDSGIADAYKEKLIKLGIDVLVTRWYRAQKFAIITWTDILNNLKFTNFKY